MSTFYIYILRCPDTSNVRYVGCTQFPTHREREHCIHAITIPKSPLQVWLKELRSTQKMPVFEIVDSFNANGFNIIERGIESNWIQNYKEQGCDLLNVAWNSRK